MSEKRPADQDDASAKRPKVEDYSFYKFAPQAQMAEEYENGDADSFDPAIYGQVMLHNTFKQPKMRPISATRDEISMGVKDGIAHWMLNGEVMNSNTLIVGEPTEVKILDKFFTHFFSKDKKLEVYANVEDWFSVEEIMRFLADNYDALKEKLPYHFPRPPMDDPDPNWLEVAYNEQLGENKEIYNKAANKMKANYRYFQSRTNPKYLKMEVLKCYQESKHALPTEIVKAILEWALGSPQKVDKVFKDDVYSKAAVEKRMMIKIPGFYRQSDRKMIPPHLLEPNRTYEGVIPVFRMQKLHPDPTKTRYRPPTLEIEAFFIPDDCVHGDISSVEIPK